MNIDELLRVALPSESDVGASAEWTPPSRDELQHIQGRFLGLSTSHTSQHHHRSRFAATDGKCRGCRWFEPRILRQVDGRRRYLVRRVGRFVPGEVTLTSREYALTAQKVIEALTTRRTRGDGERMSYLTYPAARVLAPAAGHDEDLGQAHVDRPVA
jgi:hypothetical protein